MLFGISYIYVVPNILSLLRTYPKLILDHVQFRKRKDSSIFLERGKQKWGSVTAVLMEITGKDPMCLLDLEAVSSDVREIESKQGSMSRRGMEKYALQYMAASETPGFSVASEKVIDWSFDYTS